MFIAQKILLTYHPKYYIRMVEIFDLILKLLPKQYVIYDFNSFMADWGGYMGLVLGYRYILDSTEMRFILCRSC